MIDKSQIPAPPEWWEIGGLVNVAMKDGPAELFFIVGQATVTGGLGYVRRTDADPWMLVQCMGYVTEKGKDGPVYVLRVLSRP